MSAMTAAWMCILLWSFLVFGVISCHSFSSDGWPFVFSKACMSGMCYPLFAAKDTREEAALVPICAAEFEQVWHSQESSARRLPAAADVAGSTDRAESVT
jgi:hypothetical protein